MDSVPVVPLIMCGVAVAIFLAVRQFWLWYFGTSRIIELLASIDRRLEKMPPAIQAAWTPPPEWKQQATR